MWPLPDRRHAESLHPSSRSQIVDGSSMWTFGWPFGGRVSRGGASALEVTLRNRSPTVQEPGAPCSWRTPRFNHHVCQASFCCAAGRGARSRRPLSRRPTDGWSQPGLPSAFHRGARPGPCKPAVLVAPKGRKAMPLCPPETNGAQGRRRTQARAPVGATRAVATAADTEPQPGVCR